jgi:hypothetical protein
MKLLFVFIVIATVVTVIKGYSEDDHWKDFKVNKPIPKDKLSVKFINQKPISMEFSDHSIRRFKLN